ncbi:MAG: rhodanese-like domain-containing protein [Treponema sp.]|jgi:rhodanese-related sulfurtransferase|nr:rhodanese-like domain-containing protein [Treponema sp.]
MKKLFVLLMTGLLGACAGKNPGQNNGASAPRVSKISPAGAKRVLESEEPYLLVDVRTAEEFGAGHIAGARLIPDYEIAARAPEELPDKDAPVIVYCRSGMRSSGAARALIKMGYTRIYDLGGIMGWPYDTVRGSK